MLLKPFCDYDLNEELSDQSLCFLNVFCDYDLNQELSDQSLCYLNISLTINGKT